MLRKQPKYTLFLFSLSSTHLVRLIKSKTTENQPIISGLMYPEPGAIILNLMKCGENYNQQNTYLINCILIYYKHIFF